MKISTTNTKLGAFIPSVNIPALTTCRADVPCRKGCYATKGNFKYKKVQECLQNNLNDFLSDSKKYFSDVIEFLSNALVTYKFFRWHSAGDIVNYKYLLGIIEVAKKCKKTKFLCFTKKFDLVNMYLTLGNKLPKNLNIVFSGWDKNFKIDNPFNLPVTYVKFKKDELNADFGKHYDCLGNCELCVSKRKHNCWNIKSGEAIVFNKH